MQVGKIEMVHIFRHNIMANDRIVVFFGSIDSCLCGESNGIWISGIRAYSIKLEAIIHTLHNFWEIFKNLNL